MRYKPDRQVIVSSLTFETLAERVCEQHLRSDRQNASVTNARVSRPWGTLVGHWFRVVDEDARSTHEFSLEDGVGGDFAK